MNTYCRCGRRMQCKITAHFAVFYCETCQTSAIGYSARDRESGGMVSVVEPLSWRIASPIVKRQ